ncbi:MAG: hypothetical protein WAO09_05315 [Candidatus Dormiibacterota bacterium]
MNHLLFAFAVCAALAIYPGGLAGLVAAVLGSSGALLAGRAATLSVVLRPRPWAMLLALALVGLALAPMPWPDNPVAPVGISWASGTDLGGIALSIACFWALQLLGAPRSRRGLAFALAGAWSWGLLLLSLAVHSATWSGVLGAGGVGAEAGRVVLAVTWLGSLPWVLGPPGGMSFRGFGWAAGVGMALLLGLPQLQSAPFPLTLGLWWGVMAGVGLVWAAGARFGPGLWGHLGLVPPAATLNAP